MISVLYVDDEPGRAGRLQQHLEQSGQFRLLSARSGPDALALVERVPVDVVVSVARLPGMDGVALLRECQRRRPDVPFVLYTDWEDGTATIEAFGSGGELAFREEAGTGTRHEAVARACRQVARPGPDREGERARLILAGLPTALQLFELRDDGELVLLNANPAADRICRIDHAAVAGRTLGDIFPGFLETEIPDRLGEVARTGAPWNADLVTYRDRRMASAYEIQAFSIGQGRVVVQYTVIAERLSHEEELRQIGRQWETVFQAIGQPVMILGPDQRILSVNRAAERAAGLGADEMVGRHCPGILHCTQDPPEGCPFSRFLESGSPRDPVESTIDAIDGTYLVSCTPIYDADGQLERVVHLATEITDHVRHEKALRLANDKLALISNVTRHDLRNRLMGLQGYVRMAERETDPERRARYRRLIAEAAKSMEEILTFAADYERLGSEAPEWQRVDEVVRGALDEVQVGDVRIGIETGDREVLADPLLRRVVSNLMDNSIRYGEDVSRIRVWTRRDGEALVIVYEDDGGGIPRDEKELIFYKGYGKNTGLGLYLTTQILSITGIEIRETGTLGIGARFELRCPPGTWR